MSSINRSILTLLRTTQTSSTRTTLTAARGFKTKPIFTSPVKVVGARQGHATGESLDVQLSMSKALKGEAEKGKTTPEELFAAGYGACFQSAMNAVALQRGITLPSKSIVHSDVALCGDIKKLDIWLEVDLKINAEELMKDGLERGKLEEIVREAHKVCPYSKATKGNVDVNISIE